MTTYIVVYYGDAYLVTRVVTSGGESSYTVVATCGSLTDANAVRAALAA